MTTKRALITGITGQDGGYLAELLLSKGYEVHGIRRRTSTFANERLERLWKGPHDTDADLYLHWGDMTDQASLIRIIKTVAPHEIYNLAAQSHVNISFAKPEHTADVNGLGVLRLLEAIRLLDMQEEVRFYQASTSEMFGNVQESPQSETTPFRPLSPYAISKHFACLTVANYREAYGFHASNGILFNHEGPYRGEGFVTRKITRGAAAIHHGLQKTLHLGNLDARRDWGHARDYVEGMWMMLQQEEPGDYVLATGEAHSVREFAELAFQYVGRDLSWEGAGPDEVGRCSKTGDTLVEIDPRYFRPSEVHSLVGNPRKAFDEFGWRHRTTFEQLVGEMMEADLARTARSAS